MIAAIILVFTALFLGLFAVILAVTARKSASSKVKTRLRRLAGSGSDGSAQAPVEDLLRGEELGDQTGRLPTIGTLKRLLDQAGMQVSSGGFLLGTFAASAAAFVLTYAWRGSLAISLIVMLFPALGPFLYVRVKKTQRETKFTQQLPDALTMIARSLRAGHSLTGAVELVSEELPDPAGGIFRIAYDQQRLGMRMTDSLATLPSRINSLDLHFFVTIIKINSETGGNLAEILDKLADTIRARLQIRQQVQVYTAEGRLSGYVLAGVPVAIFLIFYLLRPGYMEVFFTDRTCQLILAGTALMQVIGFCFIRKIVNIRI